MAQKRKILSAPVTINLELISSCNIKCRHCYNFWRENNDQNIIKLSKEKFDRFLEMAIDARVFHVVLSGGEPFLNFDVLEYGLKCLRENEISHSVNSNLMLANTDKIKRLRDAGMEHVLTSLNSFDPKTNDYINNQNGSFEKILRGIKIARAEGMRISVNMILSQSNKHHVYKTGKLISELGCQRLFGTRVVPNVNIDAPDQTPFKLDIDDAKLVLEQLVNVNKDFGIGIGTLVSYPLCILGDLQKFKALVGRGCPAQRGNRMSVNTDGTAHACVHEEKSYGNIFEIGIKGVFANMREWHDGSYLNKECLTCDYIEVCDSGCRMVAHSYYGRLDSSDNLMIGKEYIVKPYKMPIDNKMLEAVNNGERFIVPKRIRFRKESGFYVVNVRWANAFPIETEIAEFLINTQKNEKRFNLDDFGITKKEIMLRLFMKDVIEPVNNNFSCDSDSKLVGASIDPFTIPV